MDCVDECPLGWTCVQVPGSCPDCQFVCISRWLDLCRPCMSNPDCQQGGFASGNLCINWGAQGSFCATGCATAQDCPSGFVCQEEDVKGGTSLLCMPAAGECECTPHFQDVQALTTCFVENTIGKCLGERYCDQGLLTDCDAAIPAKEVCDGLDNDCDSMKDEDADICTGGKQCKCVGQDCSCKCPDGLFECEAGSCIDVMSSVAHCGQCDKPCIADNVETYTCQAGVCKIVKCQAGYENFDKEYPNGCECQILPELCDGKDNDCDGAVDEGEETCPGKGDCKGTCFEGVCQCSASCDYCNGMCVPLVDYFEDPMNCGYCGNKCALENTAVHGCEGSNCTPITCKNGFANCNQQPGDGCEWTVIQELCNCVDDDCDGETDETFACQVGQMKSQKCGNCGTQNSSCSGNCSWGPWEMCQGEGVCSPGQSKVEGSCGNCGQQQYTCNASCQWQPSTCLNQGICSPGASKTEGSCGNCGKYQYSCSGSCQWVQGSCTGEGVCSAGQTKTEGSCGNCGQQQYSCSASCQWQTSTCLNQGICKAGSTKTEGSCGNCGKYLYTCTNSCTWQQGSCTGQGVCKPGEKKACDACKAQVCTASCQWGTCGSGNMCGSLGAGGCGCDPACVTYGDCCGGSGSSSACKVCNYGCNSCESDTECQGSGGNCYCDDPCITYNDCCNNARSACGTQTCQNACGQDLGSGCDCDWNCGWPTQGPCCEDKTDLCG